MTVTETVLYLEVIVFVYWFYFNNINYTDRFIVIFA